MVLTGKGTPRCALVSEARVIQLEKRRVSVSAEFAAGVVAGNECRMQGGTPSKLRLVAIDDPYSAGFRAGFFQRAFKSPVDGVLHDERNRDAMVGT